MTEILRLCPEKWGYGTPVQKVRVPVPLAPRKLRHMVLTESVECWRLMLRMLFLKDSQDNAIRDLSCRRETARR